MAWSRFKKLQRLSTDEDGGAYTLSYVMVFPIVMLLVALVVESALMMSAKLGTTYAAYAGARAGSVHASRMDWGQAEERIRLAAQQAMLPFACADKSSEQSSQIDDARYIEAYQQWSSETANAGYLQSKANSAKGLVVEVVERPGRWNSDITVNVTYKFPFHVPGVGLLLGERAASGGYTFSLSSEVTLQNEGPQNSRQDLGIGYGRQL